MHQSEYRKHHFMYMITCVITKCFYHGRHSTDDLEDGYFGSGADLKKSLKQHGKNNHIMEITEFLPTFAALRAREKEIVNEDMLKIHSV